MKTRSKSIFNIFTLVALLVSLLGSAVFVTPAYAAGIVVNSNADAVADDGACSLREAITNANGDSQLYATVGECATGVGSDTITFDASLSGETIYLTSMLDLSNNVTIDGSALASPITMSGDTNGDSTGDVQVFYVYSNITAALNSLIITKGLNSFGGGISNYGTLTVTNSTLSGNSSSYGGGIYNRHILTVTNSTLSGNAADNGGGINNYGGTLTVTNSTLSGNSASNSGGGIYNSGTLTVTNSTLSGNAATYYGGSMFNDSGRMLTVTNSTLSGNSAISGGGIYNSGGTLTVMNNTLSGNSASNSGSGIGNAFGGTLNYANTIIANSSSGGDCFNYATIGTNTNNLVEDGSCFASLSGDPSLGTLADNGGPTQTMALLSGSSAIDMGDDTICVAAPVNNLDQRGETRPVDGDGDTTAICDIGAYEYPVPPPGTTKIITAFSFTSPAATGVITGAKITVAVPFGTNVTALVATFTTTGASVAVGATPQVSGTTANNFTSPVTYTVSAADATTKDYIVTVCTPTITVTSNADSGVGSLRQAIADICADGTINFNTSLSGGAIYLASTLTLSRNVTIDGSALASQITISGDTDNNGMGDVRVFLVNGGVTATLNSLIITKGAINYQSYGGGIYNNGTLTVTNSTLSGNYVGNLSNGGGIYNHYTLTVTNSTFSGNSASHTGGGIFNDGILTVTNSMFSGNSSDYGGGINNYGGTLTVTNSTFSGNYADGGGIGNSGTVTVTNSTLSNNYGMYGGGIKNMGGMLTVTNSTLSGNHADGGGGGILNVYGTLNYANTIIANSSSGGDCKNGATIGTNTNNLVEDGSCSASLSGDPKLGALASNGGLTQTFALLTGSSAIDAGNNTICAAAPVNNISQNGVTRPQGAACDIGSYELAPTAKDITAFSFTSPVAAGVITGNNIAVTVPFGTNVTALAATFTTTGASVKVGTTPQVNGTTPNNFTSPVTYMVIAADTSTKDYIVTVTIAANPAKDITAFSFTSPAATGGITGTNIAVTVPLGTNVTALVATFTTTGASVKVGTTTQVSGTTANNFTSPVTYTVIAVDASTKDYIVTVTVAAPSANKDITAFSFASPAATGVISGANIAVTVPFGTNVTALVATFTTTGASVAVGAIPQVSGTTVNNFTSPVIYTVTAADASTKDYAVTVTVDCMPITVTSIANSGVGSLRQAIADVCTGGTINFNTSLSGGAIYLASTLNLSRNVTIDGSALASQITISGDTDNNGTGNVRVFLVNGGVTATLNSLIITKGATTGYQIGGGISNGGTLTVTNSTLSGNSAYSGGGIRNASGMLTVTNSTLSGNSATYGGGIDNDGIATVTNSTLSGNSAFSGGGIHNIIGTLTVTNSTLSDNSAANGGGIYNLYGTVTVTNSTLSGNSADNGGGIRNAAGTLTVTNSTLSGNSASTTGGGIYSYSGTLNYANTIIANSSSGGDCANSGTLGTNTNNLVEDASCSASLSGNPNLGALASNGGLTQTFALLTGSSAIDAGNNTICAAAPVNNISQNGVIRPQGAACDIGSYELASTAKDITAFSFTSPAATGSITGANIVVTVPFGTNVTALVATFTTTGASVKVGATLQVSGTTANNFTSPVTYTVTAADASTKTYTVTVTISGASVPIFADVPFSYWANSLIERLYNAGITGGCSVTPLNYCPDNTVTRAQMAVFLLKGMHGSSYTPPSVGASTGFTDVALDYWAAAWIRQLAAEGITGGCGTGIYCPDSTVTRAQMAVFLLKAKHGSSYSPPAATGVFTDVPVGYWADKWIKQLAVEGVTSGCGTGVYCPDNSVTRAQMAVFLVKAFNLP